jgi:DNA repair protein RadC
MAHNHPGGDPTPSNADRDATRLLARALDPLGVRLLDHLVIAEGGTVSFRSLGLL